MKNIASKILKNNIVEHILFGVLGAMAIMLFEERLLADSGYYLFKVIDNESFWVEHNRFILVFSQWLPLIGVKLGLGLKAVLYLNSLGHILFFYCIFLISRYYYGNANAGILLLLLQTLGIMSGFFVPMFELYYGAGLLVLFYTILYYSNRKSDVYILLVIAFFVITGHPYASILMMFIIVLHAVEFGAKFIWNYLLFIALIIAVFIFKKFTASEYEQGKTDAFLSTLLNANYNLSYFKLLFLFMIKYYKELIFIELITLFMLIVSKDILKSILVVLAFIGTLMIINISYYGFEHSRYQEQVYFSLSFVVAYPFVLFLVNNKNSYKKIVFSFIAFIIIIIRIGGIWTDSEGFTSRVDEIKSYIDLGKLQGGTKFIVEKKNLNHNPNWSYPIETMLLSSFDSDGKTITICTDEDMNYNDNRANLLPSQYLYRRWEIFDVSTLNHSYFKLDSLDYTLIVK